MFYVCGRKIKEITRENLEMSKEIIKKSGDCSLVPCEYCPMPFKDGKECVVYKDYKTKVEICKKILEKGIYKEPETLNITDNVNSPKHYKLKIKDYDDIEVIDVIRAVLTPEELRGYEKGNVIKYIFREKNKNGLEDLKKSKRYLEWLIEQIEKETEREKE